MRIGFIRTSIGFFFASTQDDPDALKEQKELIEQRANGNAPRYAWDYDEHFEIYAFDRKTKNTRT